jgi:integrase
VVTLNGRDHYLGLYGTQISKDAYDRVIAEWLASGRQLAASPEITIAELLVRYLRHVDSYYTSTEPANIRLALKPLLDLYGTTQVVEFTPLSLKAIRQRFIDAKLARSEINKRVRRIVAVFKWGVEETLIDSSIHQAIKAVKGLAIGKGGIRETPPIKPVHNAYVDAIEPYVSRQVWAIIELQRLTGARSGEVVIMRTCDLVTTGKIWEFRPASHKTAHHGKERIIFLGPQAQAVVKPWLRTDTQAYLFSPAEAERERRAEQRDHRKTKVQPSQQNRRLKRPRKQPGERYTPGSLRQAITRAVRQANASRPEGSPEIPNWHPHQLRHAAGTRVRREFGLDASQAVLGHASVNMTEHYAELDAQKASEAMAKIG